MNYSKLKKAELVALLKKKDKVASQHFHTKQIMGQNWDEITKHYDELMEDHKLLLQKLTELELDKKNNENTIEIYEGRYNHLNKLCDSQKKDITSLLRAIKLMGRE